MAGASDDAVRDVGRQRSQLVPAPRRGWASVSAPGARGDALFDLATLTLGHTEHLGDVIAGYGTDVDRELIRAWWSLRCLSNVRWLVEHGYGPPEEYPEVAMLRSTR